MRMKDVVFFKELEEILAEQRERERFIAEAEKLAKRLWDDYLIMKR